ncbi:CHRNB1 [Mytilus edulis]|uniref:CHRNB1 n=1 Tax=Mytilus edulis TaxID=6550 RepID=A0A8S3SSF1_MYTED|nr:CHRNB1 [Mytilus edulis]
MQVDLDFYLVGINGIDEITQKLTTTGFLFISWTDEYLIWTPASHGGVEYIYVSQSDIWKPDITLQNGFSKLKELGSSFINVQICQTANSILDVNVTKGSRGILLEALDPNGVWSVVSTTAGDDVLSSESRVVFTITLERSSAYYVMNVIVPVILLGILNVFTFVIPADSGEKMGYSITVFLAFAVFLTIISSELPKTSGSLLGNYLMFQMGMGTFVVAVTALELRIHHRKDKVPNKIQRIFRSKCKTRVKSSDKTFDNPGKEKESEDGEKTWSDITSTTDFILFWVSLVSTFIVTVTILGLLSSKY